MTPAQLAAIREEFIEKFGAAPESYGFSHINYFSQMDGWMKAHTSSKMARDAGRWNGLLNCVRIRILGWAGCDETGKPNDPDGYVHFGAEFWTHHNAKTLGGAKQIITAFADAAIEQEKKHG